MCKPIWLIFHVENGSCGEIDNQLVEAWKSHSQNDPRPASIIYIYFFVFTHVYQTIAEGHCG